MKRASCLLAAGLAFSCGGHAPERVAGTPPRHVFLIVLDTLRADHLGLYGQARDTSPVLDGLARKSAVFEQAHAASSNTLESMVAMLGSVSPLAGNAYRDGVPAGAVSLQKAFAADGFYTLAVIGNPRLKVHESFFGDGFAYRHFVNQEQGETWGANTTDETTSIVLDALDTRFDPAGRNFFFIHYLDPHDPYAAPRDYGFHDGPVREARPAVRELEAAYDGEIRYLDEHLSRLFDKLLALGVLEDSLVLITSDHGEEFLDHGLLKHGLHLYQETIRVPWLLYGPAFVRPGRDRRPVGGIDVAPTLLDLAGVAVPAAMRGRNVLADREERPVFFASHFEDRDLRGMRAGRYKVIEDRRAGTLELFDLARDPRELEPLDPRHHPAWPPLAALYERAGR